MMVLQQGACLLYELYSPNPSSSTTGWSNLVLWNLSGSPEIPASYDIGSTTQAGTPLLPGVIWPSEIGTGEIHHAIDIVMADNAIMPCAFVPPASTVRYSGAPAGQGIPYGARFRLKSTFDTSHFTGTQALVVVHALQRYGMIPTDASGESRSVFRLGQDTDGALLERPGLALEPPIPDVREGGAERRLRRLRRWNGDRDRRVRRERSFSRAGGAIMVPVIR